METHKPNIKGANMCKEFKKLVVLIIVISLHGCALPYKTGREFNLNDIVTSNNLSKVVIYRKNQLSGVASSYFISDSAGKLGEVSVNSFLVISTDKKNLNLSGMFANYSSNVPVKDPISMYININYKKYTYYKEYSLKEITLSRGDVRFFTLDAERSGVKEIVPVLIEVEKEQALKELKGTKLALL